MSRPGRLRSSRPGPCRASTWQRATAARAGVRLSHESLLGQSECGRAKGKPLARVGRKATGLTEPAGLPRRQSPRACGCTMRPRASMCDGPAALGRRTMRHRRATRGLHPHRAADRDHHHRHPRRDRDPDVPQPAREGQGRGRQGAVAQHRARHRAATPSTTATCIRPPMRRQDRAGRRAAAQPTSTTGRQNPWTGGSTWSQARRRGRLHVHALGAGPSSFTLAGHLARRARDLRASP